MRWCCSWRKSSKPPKYDSLRVKDTKALKALHIRLLPTANALAHHPPMSDGAPQLYLKLLSDKVPVAIAAMVAAGWLDPAVANLDKKAAAGRFLVAFSELEAHVIRKS